MSEPDVTAAPVLVLLAGPNGSGKSTFFTEYITGLGLPFVNADRVAAALRAADPTARTDEIDLRLVALYAEGQLAGQRPPLPSWTRGLPGLGQP